jgi:hypothetical protein
MTRSYLSGSERKSARVSGREVGEATFKHNRDRTNNSEFLLKTRRNTAGECEAMPTRTSGIACDHDASSCVALRLVAHVLTRTRSHRRSHTYAPMPELNAWVHGLRDDTSALTRHYVRMRFKDMVPRTISRRDLPVHPRGRARKVVSVCIRLSQSITDFTPS